MVVTWHRTWCSPKKVARRHICFAQTTDNHCHIVMTFRVPLQKLAISRFADETGEKSPSRVIIDSTWQILIRFSPREAKFGNKNKSRKALRPSKASALKWRQMRSAKKNLKHENILIEIEKQPLTGPCCCRWSQISKFITKMSTSAVEAGGRRRDR